MNEVPNFSPDPTAVQMTLSGDLEAFNELVLKYQNLAFSQAYAVLGDTTLAEDVVQDSFIKAYQNIHTLRGDSFRAWLLKIVTNTAISQLRYQKSRRTQPLFISDEEGEDIESSYWLADSSMSVEAAVDYNEDAKSLYQVLDELPEIYRRVLFLVDVYELDHAAAAEMLNIPLGTVKSRIARARLQVKKKLISQNWNNNFSLGING